MKEVLTRLDVATWGCIVTANVHVAGDKYFLAIFWIVLTLGCILARRRLA